MLGQIIISKLADIFNDNIYSSRLSLYVNSLIIALILISTLEIILETEPSLQSMSNVFHITYISTSSIFLLELILRYIISSKINPGYSGFLGKIRFTLNFYTFIDILAVLPLIMMLLGFEALLYLKALRIFRILKILRYLPSLAFLKRAVFSRKAELIISLQIISILTLFISIGLYYAESQVPNSPFNSITQAFLWSVAKFIQNIGGYGQFDPITPLGQFLATLNGILGIALFALPAGIVASGFVDEIVLYRKNEELKKQIDSIINYFDQSYKKKKPLNNRMAYSRFYTFDTIETKLYLHEYQIFECINKSENLRLRAMKSSDDVKFNDIKIIERFFKNKSYGFLKFNENAKVFVVNPMGNLERSISHYTYTLIDNLGYNYLSREVEFITKTGENIKSNYSPYFLDFERNINILPDEFIEYMNEIKKIDKNNLILVICSAKSGRGDFIIEYGNKKDNIGIIENVSTIKNAEILEKFKSMLELRSQKVDIIMDSLEEASYSFKVLEHTIGNYDSSWIGKAIHKLTGNDVITIYVNIKHLTGDNGLYYASLRCLIDTCESVLGNYKKNKLINL